MQTKPLGLRANVARMTLKKRVEDNPFTYLLGVGVAVGSVVFFVVSYFASEKLAATIRTYDAEVADYKNKLASINRKLAGGDYMNVAQFVVRRGDRDHVPTQSKFYADDYFYAPALPNWTYKKTTDVDFFTSIYGEDGKKQVNDITRLAPVHLWNRGPLTPIGNHDAIQNLAPCIYLQRYPTAELAVQLNLQASKNSQPAAFQGDIIGAMLAQTFSSLFTTLPFTSETQVYLLNINKVSNVLYCQFLLTLHNVTVDSRKRDSYFVTFETIVISTKDNVYTICDFVPSEEPMPRGQVPAELTEWLNGFAVFSE